MKITKFRVIDVVNIIETMVVFIGILCIMYSDIVIRFVDYLIESNVSTALAITILVGVALVITVLFKVVAVLIFNKIASTKWYKSLEDY